MILPFHILHVLPLWQVRMNASPTGGIEQAKTILRRFPQWIDQSINDGFSSATLESMGCLMMEAQAMNMMFFNFMYPSF